MFSAYNIGAGLARLFHPFFPGRRKIAIDNILKSSLGVDENRAKEIERAAWAHIAGHIAEALRVPAHVNADNWREHLDFSRADPSAVKLLLEETDEPVLLVSAHHGTWEPATNILSFSRPMMAIARTMNNRFAAGWMRKYHFRGPVTIIDKNRGFTPSVIKQWQETKAALTILVDQHASPRHAVRASFLGRQAWCFTSAARIAVRTGVRVVAGTFVRLEPYRYALVGGAPLRFGRADSIQNVVETLNERLGDAIRQFPEQYLWMHRRWR